MAPWVGLELTRKLLSDKVLLAHAAKLTPTGTPMTSALG